MTMVMRMRMMQISDNDGNENLDNYDNNGGVYGGDATTIMLVLAIIIMIMI